MQVRSILVCALVAFASTFAAGRVHHRHAQPEMIDATNIDTMFGASVKSQFESFKAQHGKVYASPEHESNRFQIFQDNLNRIAEMSAKNPEATFGLNKFADMHPTEFKNTYLNYKPAVGDAAVLRQAAPVVHSSRSFQAVPSAFDWRAPGSGKPVAVTPVKDQGQCGSCWAFSAVETVESAFILAGNPATLLSEEQVVDCDSVDGGCNGGDTPTAYDYIKKNGIQSEQSYPYTAGTTGNSGSCKYSQKNVAAKISGFTYATPSCSDDCLKQDEAKLAESLYNIGPISICVDASQWQFYTSGIFTKASCTSAYNTLDHCVQLVGFGVDTATGTKFWSVRNSWTTGWGEAGYIRLKYGENTCGVADEATNVQIA